MHSIYGVGVDWPISYDDLEPWYSQAETLYRVRGDVDTGAVNVLAEAHTSSGYTFPWALSSANLTYVGEVDWYQKGADFLIKNQKKDGSWYGGSGFIGTLPDTCFGVIFLARGRAPVVFNKLNWEGGEKATAGNWNQRPRDVANAVRWIGKQVERDLNWHIITLQGPDGTTISLINQRGGSSDHFGGSGNFTVLDDDSLFEWIFRVQNESNTTRPDAAIGAVAVLTAMSGIVALQLLPGNAPPAVRDRPTQTGP